MNQQQITEPTEHVNPEFNQYMDYYIQLLRLDSKGKVLIVEDDPLSYKILERAVHEFSPHIKCLSATSAEQAWKIVNRTKIDAIIADYFLEGMGTGLDLCEQIQKEYSNIKCVIVSSLKIDQFQKISQRSPVHPDFLEKPVPAKSIKHYLLSIYGGHNVV
jgi:response regulator of citrate/malate metabolism